MTCPIHDKKFHGLPRNTTLHPHRASMYLRTAGNVHGAYEEELRQSPLHETGHGIMFGLTFLWHGVRMGYLA